MGPMADERADGWWRGEQESRVGALGAGTATGAAARQGVPRRVRYGIIIKDKSLTQLDFLSLHLQSRRAARVYPPVLRSHTIRYDTIRLQNGWLFMCKCETYAKLHHPGFICLSATSH